jgi:alkylation response protein AidB-like acyl-CoA dehydrogenase
MEVLGRALSVEPMLEEVVLAAGLLARAGSPAQKASWLPSIMDGSAHVALAHIEPSARFELTEVRTVARGNELTGEKSLVLSGEAADAYLVSARRGADGGGIGLYLVPADARGLERTSYRIVDGSVASRLLLQATPAEPLTGGYGELAATVDAARVAAGAEMLGLMSYLLDSTLEYVRNRKQFGAPLGSFQVVQHRLADLYASLELSRSQLYRAALFPDPRERAKAIAGMKAYLNAAAVSMGEQCMHLHGAMGVSDEVAIGHAHKRILVLATLFGDADHELARYVRLTSDADEGNTR